MLQRQLGDMQIHRIIESEQPDFDPMAFFPETTPDDWVPHQSWLQPWCLEPISGNLIFPMQSFLVRGPRHTILVDTCVGDHKERQRPSWNMTSSGEYLRKLVAAGVSPEEAASICASSSRRACHRKRWILSCAPTCTPTT